MSDRAVDVLDEAAHPAHRVVVVVADPHLVAGRGAGGLDALLELLVLAFQGGIVALIVRGLMAAWSFLLRPFELYDLRLSRRVLGGARPGRRGLRLLRHGLGSALLALLFVLGSELPDGRSGLFGLALFGLFLTYAAVASRDPFFRGRQRSRTGASR